MPFDLCPRCGFEAYEHLESYSYCASCDYSPVFEREVYRDLSLRKALRLVI